MISLLHVTLILSGHVNRTRNHMSRIMRKPYFCICKNKGTDQLHGNHAADHRLCSLHSTTPLLSKLEI